MLDEILDFIEDYKEAKEAEEAEEKPKETPKETPKEDLKDPFKRESSTLYFTICTFLFFLGDGLLWLLTWDEISGGTAFLIFCHGVALVFASLAAIFSEVAAVEEKEKNEKKHYTSIQARSKGATLLRELLNQNKISTDQYHDLMKLVWYNNK